MSEHDKALHQLEKYFESLSRWYLTLPLILPDFPYSDINFAITKLEQLKKETERAILKDYKDNG